MTAAVSSPSARSASSWGCATPAQEVVLRRAAEVAHKSLTDFILDSACLAAEQTPARSTVVHGLRRQYRSDGSAGSPRTGQRGFA